MVKLIWPKRSCAVLLLCASTVIASPLQTFTTLLSFTGTNGAHPLYGSLIQDAAGNLYGTTSQGGANSAGTVFQITANGTLTVLYSFCAQAGCPDGSDPWGGLVLGTDGNFYGATSGGGTSNYGTIFKITPSGTLTTLHNFAPADGGNPYALIQASDANFYGTAPAGGAYTYGTVYRLTPSGEFTTLYSFCAQPDCIDGEVPSGLVEGADGNFYGTTQLGGVHQQGTVFKITPAGALTTLYSFCALAGCADGMAPSAALIQTTGGDFYGTTSYGPNVSACLPVCGTVFKITPAGALTTLHTFGPDEGGAPSALMQAADGNLYGTAAQGGNPNNPEGTVYQITPSGALTVLYGFCAQPDCADGANPNAGLVQGSNGILYGTTLGGGASGDGVVFSVELQSPGTPSINPGSILNAAGYAAQVAPGSIAAAFGKFLVPDPMLDTASPLQTAMEGLSFEWSSFCALTGGGCPQVVASGFAPLFYVSGGQVNLQIPWELPPNAPGQLGWQNAFVPVLNGQNGAAQTVNVVPFAPAIFTTNAQGTGQGAILNSSYQLVDSSNPAGAGTYIQIFCTGLGQVTNQPADGAPALSNPLSWTTTIPTVTIGGVSAPVSFYGLAPGYVGLNQVNAQIPAGLAANNAAPVVISISGATSNTVTIAVGP